MSQKSTEVREVSQRYELKAAKPAVLEGYKQTEVGIIPDDWGVAPLRQEVAKLEAGVSVNSVDENLGSYAHDQSVLKTSSIADGHFYPDECKKVAPRDLSRVSLSPKADTLLVSRMNTPDLVGECGYISKDFPSIFLPDRLWMTKKKDSSTANFRWLSYLLSSKLQKSRIKGLATGTSGSMKNISKDSLLNILLPFPPPREQEAIATALSDVDALLEELGRLIAKKRDIKQATMQQLLTGQTRLRGFEGEWDVKSLGEVLEVCHGRSQREVVIMDGKYPIWATGGEIGRTNTPLHEGPSVLIGRKGTIDRPRYAEGPFWTVDTLFYTKILGKNSAKYLFYRFCMIEWKNYNEASGVPSLNARTIESIELKLPSPDEQKSISSVLSDMDAELEALEQRRAKTEALKQAMMQELLTGRTRLVNPSG